MGLGSREPLGHRLELSSDEERYSESCSFPKTNQLMNVSRCNRGSRLPRANSKNIFLQHPLELWLAPGLACLGSRNPPCYQLWAPLGKALQKFSHPGMSVRLPSGDISHKRGFGTVPPFQHAQNTV